MESAPRAAYDPTGRRTWYTVETEGNPLTFVVFRPGRFVMGSPADEAERSDYEGPQQDTTIARSFALCDREVTRSEFEAFMAATETTGLPNIDEWSPQGVEPVVAATWEEAMAYGQWCSAHLISMAVSRGARGRPSSLEEMQQLHFSLPTEAEWEYACRAGTTTAYSFGSDRSRLNQYGWYADNSGLKTHEAGILRPNPAGLFNIHGQCWEWCLDWYGPYTNDPVVDNRGPSTGDRKVLRGGCWNLGARYARSACRNAHIPPNRNYYISFRLAMSLPEIDQTWTPSDPNPIFWTGP
jgi:formylglycine-generating enzyme required for sulfatase activity